MWLLHDIADVQPANEQEDFTRQWRPFKCLANGVPSGPPVSKLGKLRKALAHYLPQSGNDVAGQAWLDTLLAHLQHSWGLDMPASEASDGMVCCKSGGLRYQLPGNADDIRATWLDTLHTLYVSSRHLDDIASTSSTPSIAHVLMFTPYSPRDFNIPPQNAGEWLKRAMLPKNNQRPALPLYCPGPEVESMLQINRMITRRAGTKR